MKVRLKYLKNYSLQTKDEKKANIKDFLFDEHKWILRYAEADFGSFLFSKRQLIPRVFFGQPDESASVWPIEIKREEIERCPLPDAHMPVSREFEAKMNEYFEIDNYWAPDLMPPAGATGTYFPPRPVDPPEPVKEEINEKKLDSKLRSFKEIKGYEIEAENGTFGEVYDLITDTKDFQIVYIIIDTEGLLPWSKKIQLPVSHLKKISYAYERIYINLKKENLENAPVFDDSKYRDESHEKDVFDFFADMPGLDMK